MPFLRLTTILLFAAPGLYAQESFAVMAMSATLFILLLLLAVSIAYRLKQLATDILIYQNLFADAPAALIRIDRHDKIDAVNHDMQALLGMSAPELIGQVWYERLFASESSVQVRHLLYKQQKKNATFSFESSFYRPDRQTIRIQWKIRRIVKKPSGYLISANEINGDF